MSNPNFLLFCQTFAAAEESMASLSSENTHALPQQKAQDSANLPTMPEDTKQEGGFS